MRRTLGCAILAMMLLPSLAMAIPSEYQTEPKGWWTETMVDRDGDGIGDMVEKYMHHPLFKDDDNTIPLIIDYWYTPGEKDIDTLEKEVDYRHQWTLERIDALAGRVPVDQVVNLLDIPGVVMIELDGILEALNGDVAAVHGVDIAQEQTGYDGTGVGAAIIDTGIDGLHVGLDDQDDDNSTYDPKIVGFYDAVNNPSLTNGSEVFPYDDHGHGSHCAGTTAGTGAPDYAHPGMAPQATLIGVKVLDGGGSGSFATVMAGMQWTVDTRYQFNTRVASMSLGGPGPIEWTSSEEDSVNRMANEMVRAGIALFIAAGNNAVSAQIGTPGSAEDVITVGALDKDTSIAFYSSQGPTEEGRVKPNIAFVGSNVNSVAANTGTGYTGMSGTSMATPGAAGVAALMYQANPELSPFDIRNIMQETAVYRQCHYMGANEGCPEDIIPKNRQNNVYGHGEVRAPESVMEAAERNYLFNSAIQLNIKDPISNERIVLGPGQSITINLSQGVDTVQWRSNHLRDDWSNLHSYEHGASEAILDYTTIVHQLEHLPGVNISGNHTLSVRGIEGETSSPLLSFDIMTDDSIEVESEETKSGNSVLLNVMMIVVFIVVAIMIVFMITSSTDEEVNGFTTDSDIESVVEAEILD